MDAKDTIVRLRARVRELSLSLHPASVIEQVLLEEADTLIIALCAERDAAVESRDEARDFIENVAGALGLHPDTDHTTILAQVESVRSEARNYPDLQLQRDEAREALAKIIEDEARCCPEDIGFEEHIDGLREAVRVLRGLVDQLERGYHVGKGEFIEDGLNEARRNVNLNPIASAAVKGGEEKAT